MTVCVYVFKQYIYVYILFIKLKHIFNYFEHKLSSKLKADCLGI